MLRESWRKECTWRGPCEGKEGEREGKEGQACKSLHASCRLLACMHVLNACILNACLLLTYRTFVDTQSPECLISSPCLHEEVFAELLVEPEAVAEERGRREEVIR